MVSTHSRPKAAGQKAIKTAAAFIGFNTQPPEGGWMGITGRFVVIGGFNTQPPEGGWAVLFFGACKRAVSTHSRPKAAGTNWRRLSLSAMWFQHTAARRRLGSQCARYGGGNRFNTQPPEGGWGQATMTMDSMKVSTHSRPKAAGKAVLIFKTVFIRFNTQPPEGGWCDKGRVIHIC